MDSKARSDLHQRRSRIQRRAQSIEAVEFFNILTSPQLLETTEALLPEHRERLYPPTVTLSMFMRQTLEADGSCQKAVNGWAAQRAADGLSACSVRTGAYCKARQRLPVQMIAALTRQTGQLLSQKALRPWQWRGRAVKLVDGTGLSMPDTPENQAVYPQPSSQAAGVGFPLARLVALICLATGAALDAAMGPHSGKGTGELALVRSLLEGFRAGDVMVADALYCNYFLIATLVQRGVDVVFEQNGSRITDFRRGRSLGTRDHIVCWPKPARPEWMTPEQYAQAPQDIMLRTGPFGLCAVYCILSGSIAAIWRAAPCHPAAVECGAGCLQRRARWGRAGKAPGPGLAGPGAPLASGGAPGRTRAVAVGGRFAAPVDRRAPRAGPWCCSGRCRGAWAVAWAVPAGAASRPRMRRGRWAAATAWPWCAGHSRQWE